MAVAGRCGPEVPNLQVKRLLALIRAGPVPTAPAAQAAAKPASAPVAAASRPAVAISNPKHAVAAAASKLKSVTAVPRPVSVHRAATKVIENGMDSSQSSVNPHGYSKVPPSQCPPSFHCPAHRVPPPPPSLPPSSTTQPSPPLKHHPAPPADAPPPSSYYLVCRPLCRLRRQTLSLQWRPLPLRETSRRMRLQHHPSYSKRYVRTSMATSMYAEII